MISTSSGPSPSRSRSVIAAAVYGRSWSYSRSAKRPAGCSRIASTSPRVGLGQLVERRQRDAVASGTSTAAESAANARSAALNALAAQVGAAVAEARGDLVEHRAHAVARLAGVLVVGVARGGRSGSDTAAASSAARPAPSAGRRARRTRASGRGARASGGTSSVRASGPRSCVEARLERRRERLAVEAEVRGASAKRTICADSRSGPFGVTSTGAVQPRPARQACAQWITCRWRSSR